MSNGNTQATQGGGQGMAVYLLAIPGTLAPATLEEARAIHNETAGAPQNVAAARSLGDLSHMVYVPAMPAEATSGAGEFLIMDLWNSLDGLGQFFANPQVQEQGGRIFSKRNPVVFAPAPGFYSYHFPTPHGMNDRIVAIVRGMVSSHDEARAIHNAFVEGNVNSARKAGDVSHEAYFRMAPPDSPEALELLAVDVWMSAQGMGEFYGNPDFLTGLSGLFTAPPETSTWVHPAGEWVEW